MEKESIISVLSLLLASDGFRSAELVEGRESFVSGGVGLWRQGGEEWGVLTSFPQPPIFAIFSPCNPSFLVH